MIKQIEKVVCEKELICREAIHTKSRKRELVLARQIIMYFTRELDKEVPLKAIGGYFGRDHATAIHACRAIKNLIDTDRMFKSRMRGYELKLISIDLNLELPEADTIKALTEEALNLERTITELNKRANLIRNEIKCLSIRRARLAREELKALSVKKPVEIKKPEPVLQKPVEHPRNIPVNNNPLQGAYHGYVQHC